MEDKTKVILLVIAAVAALVFIVWFSIYFSKGNRKGRAAERKVARKLKKLGRNDNIRILNNVFINVNNKDCEIDHLVFGRFGVLVIDTKGISGTLSGEGKRLVHKDGIKTRKMYNPQLTNRAHIDNIIHHLRKGGFTDVAVTGAVVFTDKDLVLNTSVGIKLDELETVYEGLRDAGCNQDVLLHYFRKTEIKNPFKKLAHKFAYDE